MDIDESDMKTALKRAEKIKNFVLAKTITKEGHEDGK